MSIAKTWISILNWNGAHETVKTLASVRALPNVHTVVVDNGSTNNSVAELEAYLKAQNIPGQTLSEAAFKDCKSFAAGAVTLVAAAQNKGFAGGNNIVLRVALQQPQTEAVWLLNNDALAHPETLTALEQTLQQNPACGFAGSVILDAGRPTEVQCYGVKYFPLLGISKLLGKGETWKGSVPAAAPQPGFQHGASLLVRTRMLAEVGLLDERFFLYFEEQDWQERAVQKGWSNLLTPASTVHHLGSMSTDSSRHLFFYHYNRSALLFSRLHNTALQRLTNLFTLPLILLLRTRGNLKSLGWGLKGLWHGLRFPL